MDEFLKVFPDAFAKSIVRAQSAGEVLGGVGEAIFITTPHNAHFGYAEKAFLAGKHIFCEKPLCAEEYEISSLHDLLRRAEARKLVFTSCHPRRFDRVFNAVKYALPGWTREFGAVREVLFRFFYHVPPAGWKEQDSLLLDHMNHEIDMVNFLLGFNRVHLKKLWDGFDSYAVAGIRDDGIGIYFSGERRLQTKTYRNELEIRFERGRITAYSLLRGGAVYPRIVAENFEYDKKYEITFAPHSYDEAFVLIMKNFYEAIRGKVPNYLDHRSLLENTRSCVSLRKRDEYKTATLYE